MVLLVLEGVDVEVAELFGVVVALLVHAHHVPHAERAQLARVLDAAEIGQEDLPLHDARDRVAVRLLPAVRSKHHLARRHSSGGARPWLGALAVSTARRREQVQHGVCLQQGLRLLKCAVPSRCLLLQRQLLLLCPPAPLLVRLELRHGLRRARQVSACKGRCARVAKAPMHGPVSRSTHPLAPPCAAVPPRKPCTVPRPAAPATCPPEPSSGAHSRHSSAERCLARPWTLVAVGRAAGNLA
jgi:hypothetical protein